MCDTGYYGYENVKVMAHALVGYVSGELAGSKSSFSNALAAGVNKFVTEEILKDEKTRLHYANHPEELQWISAALGAAIGQMAGGDATSGASIAASGTKNNRLSETQYEAYKKELAEAGNNPAKIKEVLTIFTDIDKANEDLLESKLEDQDFYDGLAKALKENPDLKEYQGVIINGKSIQTAYSGEKELAVGYGGVDENGNYILKDNKVAIDARDKDLQTGIGMALVTGGVGIATDVGGVVGYQVLDNLLIKSQIIKGVYDLFSDNTNQRVNGMEDLSVLYMTRNYSPEIKLVASIIENIFKASHNSYSDIISKSTKKVEQSK